MLITEFVLDERCPVMAAWGCLRSAKSAWAELDSVLLAIDGGQAMNGIRPASAYLTQGIMNVADPIRARLLNICSAPQLA